MPIVRRTDCVPLPMVVCPVVAAAMLESRVASCVHCVENVACLRQAFKVETCSLSYVIRLIVPDFKVFLVISNIQRAHRDA